MIRNGKPIDHSNVGGLWGSLVAFIVCSALLLGSMYALNWWTLDTVWIPGLVFTVAAVLCFAIPQHVIGRSDTADPVVIHAPQRGGSHTAGH
ncbi:MAG: hypothetical protein Q4G34_00475 [Micrococcus sp.]|nr:hypothetical protein [Micrococcus sp.]